MKGILTDKEIGKLCLSLGLEPRKPMLDPYCPELVRKANNRKVISYGQSSLGYDIRSGDFWDVFVPQGMADLGQPSGVLDPKNFGPEAVFRMLPDADGSVVIPPRGYALTYSVEYFHMPPDVIGVALGKSTYARSGISCNITPLEPGWEGQLVIEVANLGPRPCKVYCNEGIAQVLFFRSDGVPGVSYADRAGKYQGQKGITHAIV
jgi:dCTP deaminase